MLYSGLLDVAHQKNLNSVDVELIQFPSDENKQTAICRAKVETVDGREVLRYRLMPIRKTAIPRWSGI